MPEVEPKSVSTGQAPRKRLRTRTLTNRERQALRDLPRQIEAWETEQQALHDAVAEPAIYRKAPGTIAEAKARLETLARELDAAYERWAELEAVQLEMQASRKR